MVSNIKAYNFKDYPNMKAFPAQTLTDSSSEDETKQGCFYLSTIE